MIIPGMEHFFVLCNASLQLLLVAVDIESTSTTAAHLVSASPFISQEVRATLVGIALLLLPVELLVMYR